MLCSHFWHKYLKQSMMTIEPLKDINKWVNKNACGSLPVSCGYVQHWRESSHKIKQITISERDSRHEMAALSSKTDLHSYNVRSTYSTSLTSSCYDCTDHFNILLKICLLFIINYNSLTEIFQRNTCVRIKSQCNKNYTNFKATATEE